PVAGALIIIKQAERFGRRRVLVFDLVATPAALALYAISPSVTTAVLALGLVGALYIGILSGLNSVVQLRAPAEFRARVLSLFLMALGVIYPLGALAQGAVADVIGLADTTVIAGVVMVAVIAGLGLFRPDLLRTLGDAPGEPAVAEGSTAAVPTR
ncbi:MAG: MFS transporter, partial [Actinomycetota bacterium]|nr:MFS transporter [Actinomycetota bacterium]